MPMILASRAHCICCCRLAKYACVSGARARALSFILHAHVSLHHCTFRCVSRKRFLLCACLHAMHCHSVPHWHTMHDSSVMAWRFVYYWVCAILCFHPSNAVLCFAGACKYHLHHHQPHHTTNPTTTTPLPPPPHNPHQPHYHFNHLTVHTIYTNFQPQRKRLKALSANKNKAASRRCMGRLHGTRVCLFYVHDRYQRWCSYMYARATRCTDLNLSNTTFKISIIYLKIITFR